MNNKIFSYSSDGTGKGIYLLIVREFDGAWYDHTDGKFRGSPAIPSVVMTEKTLAGVATQIHQLTIASQVWDNGYYTVFAYEEVAVGSVDTANDSIVAEGRVKISEDVIVERGWSHS